MFFNDNFRYAREIKFYGLGFGFLSAFLIYKNHDYLLKFVKNSGAGGGSGAGGTMESGAGGGGGTCGAIESIYNLLKKWIFKPKKELTYNENQKILSSKFNTKYIDIYNKKECVELKEGYLKSLKQKILLENTPRGNVLLYYDFENECFDYYCDTKHVPFLYLETVGRHYVCMFNCKKIYIDGKEEFDKAVIKTNKKKEARKKQEEIMKKGGIKGQNNIFATFKQYNRKGQNSNVDNREYIIRENLNKYCYKGKMKDYSFLKTDKNKNKKNNSNKEMSYKEFMEKMKLKKS